MQWSLVRPSFISLLGSASRITRPHSDKRSSLRSQAAGDGQFDSSNIRGSLRSQVAMILNCGCNYPIVVAVKGISNKFGRSPRLAPAFEFIF